MRWPARAGVARRRGVPRRAHPRLHGDAACATSGSSAIDVQQFHVWHDDWLEQGDWLETVEALKQEGKIRAFGVSINDHAAGDRARARPLGPRRHRAGDLQRVRPEPGGRAVPRGAGARRRRARARAVRRGRADRLDHAATEFPEGDFRAHYFQRRPQAGGGRARAGDRRRPRHRARADRRDRAALHPLRRRGLDRDPRHALGPQRRAQHGGGRRACRPSRWGGCTPTAGCATSTGDRLAAARARSTRSTRARSRTPTATAWATSTASARRLPVPERLGVDARVALAVLPLADGRLRLRRRPTTATSTRGSARSPTSTRSPPRRTGSASS